MTRIGVCSWSLRPTGPQDLVKKVIDCGLEAVQLALDPIRTGAWNEQETATVLRGAGIPIVSGMMAFEGEDYSTLDSIRQTGGIRPDATWAANRIAARQNAALASRLGIGLVTFHAGFLPPALREGGDKDTDKERARLLARLEEIAGIFEDADVDVALETGQESAETLLQVLADLETPVGINFDPANMILYDMGNPVAALKHLAPFVRQIHIKDATPTQTPGLWGTEVTAGTGGAAGVDWARFFKVLSESGLCTTQACDLVVERESGEDRIADVRAAAALVRRLAPP